MDKEEAIRVMLDGELVVAANMKNNEKYVWEYLNGQFYRGGKVKDISAMSIKNYEIYQPPKKKVKMWLWAYKGGYTKIMMSTIYFYTSKEDVIATFKQDSVTDVVPILGTEIEVEI